MIGLDLFVQYNIFEIAFIGVFVVDFVDLLSDISPNTNLVSVVI